MLIIPTVKAIYFDSIKAFAKISHSCPFGLLQPYISFQALYMLTRVGKCYSIYVKGLSCFLSLV